MPRVIVVVEEFASAGTGQPRSKSDEGREGFL